MLAEIVRIVRSSFIGRGDPSELCSQICCRCCDLQPLSRVIPPQKSEWSLSREPRRIMINWTKLTRESNSLITSSNITLHIICINFQVVVFENNFREFGLPRNNQATYFLLNQGRSHLKKELIYKRRCGSLFCYYFGFSCLVRVTQHDFL